MIGTEQTLKTYHERINVVIQYIHNHLDERLDIDNLAGLSCYSPYHFHRIMHAYLGESLGSYIQRARIAVSAQLLRFTELPISEVSIRVGYESPASFNKVFRKRFGISPGDYRRNPGYQLPFREPVKTKIGMENISKQPQIRVIDDIKVVYANAIGTYGDHNTDNAWKTVCGYAGKNGLFGPSSQFIGICYDDPRITEPDRCHYEACISVATDAKPEGRVGVKTIRGGKFAVFLVKGPFTLLLPAYDYIFGEWIERTKTQLGNEPGFEKYLKSPDSTPAEELETEIWIPVL